MQRLLGRAAALAAVLLAGFALPASAKPQFFAAPPAQPKAANAKYVSSPASAVRFNADEMLALRHLDEVRLTLPNGLSYDVVLDLVTRHEGGIASWVGRIKDHGNHYRVIVTTGPAGSYGSVDTPMGQYRIVPGDGNDWLVDVALEESLQPKGYEPTPREDSREVPETLLTPPDLSNARFVTAAEGVNTVAAPKHTPSLAEVDLMFVVTQGFQSYFASPAAMATRLNNLVTRANTAYADSHIGISLRLVHTAVVSYSDTNTEEDGLDAITPNCGGSCPAGSFDAAAFGNVETLRIQYGADVVSLMIRGASNSGAGIAWRPSTPSYNFMYSATKGCMDLCDNVWIHEVGHNMGNSHDRHTASWQANAGTNYTSVASRISFGYAFCKTDAYSCNAFTPGGCTSRPECSTNDPSNFSDIMAYFHSSTQRIYKFSNVDPAVTCVSTRAGADGVPRPCGIASGTSSADTATSMNNNRVALSAVRATVANNRTLTVAKNGSGLGTVTSSAAGISCGATCSGGFALDSNVTLTATPTAGSVFNGWSNNAACSGGGTCALAMTGDQSVTATFTLALGAALGSANPAAVAFGGQSMQTSSIGLPVTFTNIGAGTLTVSAVNVSGAGYARMHNCTSLALGQSCVATVTFTPSAQGAANGTLAFQTSAGNVNVALTGTGERSLVTHYYRAILNRAPDTAGKAYWDGEAARLTGLGVDINETWYVMAGYFFNSAEYQALNKTPTQYVTDLYNTFFNRLPDAGGLGYWVGEINAGLPREVVLFSFMFSPEFRTFTTGIFGAATVRPEVTLVVDFFRGLLNRLPDTESLAYWVGKLRTAQCAGAGPVYTAVDEISAFFMFSTEYTNRARSNTQFVTDMYYSFLRRGGDIGGVSYWINQVATPGSQYYFRNDARYYGFLNSPEFGARVQAVIAAGCGP